jgi:hypothetical protein
MNRLDRPMTNAERKVYRNSGGGYVVGSTMNGVDHNTSLLSHTTMTGNTPDATAVL